MRLHRLAVSDFGCIREADVHFQAGVNVLHGPNDHGKSTLVRALRMALLLPHTSSVASPYVPWDRPASLPEVTLVFETAPQRIWRLYKCFGGGTTSGAKLEGSRDGVAFYADCSGKHVDRRLWELLQWGGAKPGGRGSKRGIPRTFLGTVLLGDQADVTAVLEANLANDPDVTGKERLTAALDAFAQDPFFDAVMSEASAKVEEAFTNTGRRKRGRGSPFTEVSEAVKRANETFRRLEEQVSLGQGHRNRVAELAEQGRALVRSHQQAAEVVERARHAEVHLEARSAAEEELERATSRLAEHRSWVDAAKRTAAAVAALTADLSAAASRMEGLQSRLAAAREALQEREQALARVRSDEVERERTLRQQALHNDVLRLDAAVREAEGRLGSAREAAAQLARRDTLEEQLADSEEVRDRAKQAAAESLASIERSKSVLEAIRGAELIRGLARAEAELEAAQRATGDAAAARASAVEAEKNAAVLRASLPSNPPSQAVVASLEALQSALALARARLGGGLAITLRGAPGATATADGEDADPTSVIEATRRAEVRIGDAVVVIEAGEKTARDQAQSLAARFELEAGPVLSAAGCADLAGLKAQLDGAAAIEAQVQAALALGARHEERAVLEDRTAAQLAERTQVVERLRSRVAGVDRAAAEELLRATKVGADPGGRRVQLERSQARAEQKAAAAQAELQRSEVALASVRERLAGVRDVLARAGQEPPEGWAQAARDAVEEHRGLAAEREGCQTRLTALESERGVAISTAENACAVAREHLESARRAHEQGTTELAALRADDARLKGELSVREERAATVDLAADESAAVAARTAMAALPLEAADVDPEAAEAALVVAARTLAAHEGELQQAKGALATVGGGVAEERRDQAREALTLAEGEEHAVELDYDGWQMLTSALREAENEAGSHLGRALAVPVSERFAALTEGRYGPVLLDAQLSAQGLTAAGESRPLSALSAGTQDQLATVLRLTVAAQLGTVVVLDDHLAQTDAGRGAWMADLLKACATEAQVVMLTCRPGEHIALEDVHAVDLGAVIRRAP
jgi:energy-coupling factor transporter ATP-binding protein EcfA2